MTTQVGIVGGSGYVGGELLRLLTFHPEVEVVQVTSRRHAGQYVELPHPNLRGFSDLRFIKPEELVEVDFLFLAMPHGHAAERVEWMAELAPRIIDCSSDFRLHDPSAYERWYGGPHPSPQWLSRFAYGLPERHRDRLRDARYATGVGCNAAAVILALAPVVDAVILDRAVVDVKVGSSEAGSNPKWASHHPERSGAVRVYSPAGHRHLAEVEQELGLDAIDMSVTAIEMVRGVHVTAHCKLKDARSPVSSREVWDLYRAAYKGEPFVRLVAARAGMYRLPEPKILAGTNLCDVGFHLDADRGRLLIIAALDNLMKGAAGSAVQTMNLMLGLDERTGLTFPGLHPL